ncbi:hypothetical protein RJ640_016818 [Escallonia rubra]|uniref:ALOG domain-containing protein n=1 Tax=Escallonia rubra TaxID=112253 RepID=A0AA88U5K1_9ASTE|nr:hypothetical protein RJ640_016818 [Escallonia rubra]
MENPRSMPTTLSRYENQKCRDWNTFGQYLRNHRPPLSLARYIGAHVLEFLRYLNQFGKTKVHAHPCPFFGHPSPPAPSARLGAASTPSSAASAPPSRRTEASPSQTQLGRAPSGFTSVKSAIRSPKHGGSATRRRSGAHPITLPISAVRFKNPSDLGAVTGTGIEAACAAHPTADVFINFASYRSAAACSKTALKQPTIGVVAIIAEGGPVSNTKELIAYSRKNNKVT